MPIILMIVTIMMSPGLTYGQSGSISGLVIDAASREPLVGVYVMVRGESLGAVTDLDGRYIIRNIPLGTYHLTISSIGYNTINVSSVIVTENQRIALDFLMEPGSAELDEVTVTAYRQNSSIESVLLEIQRMNSVASGISSQQISKSQDSNAAQVMQRIPGVTILENRFVLIRGLSERYNSVLINNVVAPSTEVDKRTFSFDLISSGSLDKMLIYKSGKAELPGDFAGGVIKLFTIDNVDNNFVRINYGMGFRQGTTGRSFYQSDGSPTDVLGFDNGFRKLPASFPTTRQLQGSPRNSPLRVDPAHDLPNNFSPMRSSAFADQSVGFTYGHNKAYQTSQLSTITSINYSTGYQFYERDFYRYFEWTDFNQPIVQRFAFKDDTYQLDNKINLMSNWKYRINNNHTLSFKNLFNQIGENETIIRSGRDFIQRPGDELINYSLGYRSRSIYTGQLEGTHNFNKTSLSWVTGGSFLREDEPDLRRFRTFRPDSDPNGPFMMQMPPSSNLFDTGRYYGFMNEFSLNHGLDFTYGIGRGFGFLKSGYQIDYRQREYQARYISYLYPGFFDPTIREQLIRLPLNEIFDPVNIRNENGFIIEEGTRPIDSYDASSFTTAGYLSVEIPAQRWNIILGTRVESNHMTLNSRDDFSIIEVRNPIMSILPFINTSYSLSESAQIRFAYGRTINRPEFRELAPFVFYDYKMDAGRAGNPDLKHATIDNIDLRFEFYPRLGETITIGVFYKYFDNPIENKTFVTTESPQFGYINADFAWSYGAELELRKSLQGVTNSAIFDRFSLNMNASVILTTVDLGDGAIAQDRSRPLQGQSPFIVNSAIYYDNPSTGFNANIVYNIIGKRIYSVGDVLFPTIYEMPRHSLDVMASKKFGKQLTVKAGIQDVLNSSYRFYQDSDRDNQISLDKDHVIFSNSKGRLFSISAVIDL